MAGRRSVLMMHDDAIPGGDVRGLLPAEVHRSNHTNTVPKPRQVLTTASRGRLFRRGRRLRRAAGRALNLRMRATATVDAHQSGAAGTIDVESCTRLRSGLPPPEMGMRGRCCPAGLSPRSSPGSAPRTPCRTSGPRFRRSFSPRMCRQSASMARRCRRARRMVGRRSRSAAATCTGGTAVQATCCKLRI